MKRRTRKKIVTTCIAAAPVLGMHAGCDRTATTPTTAPADSPPAQATPVDSPRTGASPAGTASSRTPEASSASADSRPPAAGSARSTPDVSSSRGASDASRTTPLGEGFIPPEVDLSKFSAEERQLVLRSRERAIDAPTSADRIAEFGLHLCVRGFYAEAATCFERASSLLPKVMRYRYLAAIAYESAGQTSKAIDSFRRSIELEGRYPAAFSNLGNLIMDSDPIEAHAAFEKAVELDPTDVIAVYGLARCERRSGNVDRAITWLNRAIELQPTYRDALLELAELERARGDEDAAARHASQAERDGRKGLVRNDPIRFELAAYSRTEADIAREALENAKSGRIDEAIQFLRATTRRGIRSIEILQAFGEVLAMAGRHDEAILKFQDALKLEPDSSALRLLIAGSLIQLREYDQAEKLLNEAAALSKTDDAILINRLGVIDMVRGRTREAEEKFRKSAALSPGEAVHHFALAQCLAAQGRLDEAMPEIDKATRLDADDAEMLLFRGRLSAQRGLPDEALADYRKVIELRPALADAYVLAAETARGKGDEAGSIAFLESGFKAAPESPVIANDLAYSLATCADTKLRNPGRAVELGRRASASTSGANPNYLDTLATAYAANGDFAQAAETLRKAIDRSRELGAADAALAEMTARLKTYESGSGR